MLGCKGVGALCQMGRLEIARLLVVNSSALKGVGGAPEWGIIQNA